MAKVRSFKAESGISFEYRGQWYKYHAGIELEIEPGDDLESVKRKAWNTVEVELEKQVTSIIGHQTKFI